MTFAKTIFLTTYFERNLDFKKSCEASADSAHIAFTQLLLMLVFTYYGEFIKPKIVTSVQTF